MNFRGTLSLMILRGGGWGLRKLKGPGNIEVYIEELYEPT